MNFFLTSVHIYIFFWFFSSVIRTKINPRNYDEKLNKKLRKVKNTEKKHQTKNLGRTKPLLLLLKGGAHGSVGGL